MNINLRRRNARMTRDVLRRFNPHARRNQLRQIRVPELMRRFPFKPSLARSSRHHLPDRARREHLPFGFARRVHPDKRQVQAILGAGVLVFYLGLRRYEGGNLLEMRGRIRAGWRSVVH